MKIVVKINILKHVDELEDMEQDSKTKMKQLAGGMCLSKLDHMENTLSILVSN